MRILFLNPQGNFDPNDSFWTEHPDFGGQLVYVKEIALALAQLGHQVDIVTRRFDDERFNVFNNTFDYYQDVENVRIIRIPCGPEGFLQKELLWEHLHEWVTNIKSFYEKRDEPIDFITTHYGDGGLAGTMLSQMLNIPFSFTGHSLGAQKMDKLGVDENNVKVMNDKYQFAKRLVAERTAMQYASVIFTSTAQERDEQYAHPSYNDVAMVNKATRFFIAPPGANVDVFSATKPHDQESAYNDHLEIMLERDIDENRLSLPYIVSASRLDPKKNHMGMLKAYANSQTLQAIANIAISLRGVENAYEDYSNLKTDEQVIMKDMLDIIDKHHLKGKVTFVNINSQKFLASSYRYFASRNSIFTLTALYEPFGLAPIEAMSAGLPAAVTKYGGPSEVLKDAEETYGVLLDVMDQEKMIQGYIQAFKYHDFFQKQGLRRVQTTYNWTATAKRYVDAINQTKNDLTTPIVIPKYFVKPNQKDDFNIEPLIQYYINKKGDFNADS